MTPVVNGLQVEFDGRIDIKALNAGIADGRQIFESYALPGHPSFVLLDAAGGTAWRAFGPQSVEKIRAELEAVSAPNDHRPSSSQPGPNMHVLGIDRVSLKLG